VVKVSGTQGRLTIDGKPVGADPADAEPKKGKTVVPFPKGA